MGARGPKPAGKLSVIERIERKRPNPPAGMTRRARNLFRAIVAENKPEAFDTEAVCLLRAFCEADKQHFEATKRLEKEGAVIAVETKAGAVPRRNPWFDVQKESAAVMNSISTKLRKKGVNVETEKPAASPRKGLMFNG